MNSGSGNDIEIVNLTEKKKSFPFIIVFIILLLICSIMYFTFFRDKNFSTSDGEYKLNPLIIKKGYMPKANEFVDCDCDVTINDNNIKNYIKNEGSYTIDVLVNQEKVKIPLYVVDEDVNYIINEQSSLIQVGNNSINVDKLSNDLILMNKNNKFSGIILRIEKFVFSDENIYDAIVQGNKYYEEFSYQDAHGYALFNHKEMSFTIISYNTMFYSNDEISYLSSLNDINKFYKDKNYNNVKKIQLNNVLSVLSIND